MDQAPRRSSPKSVPAVLSETMGLANRGVPAHRVKRSEDFPEPDGCEGPGCLRHGGTREKVWGRTLRPRQDLRGDMALSGHEPIVAHDAWTGSAE